MFERKSLVAINSWPSRAIQPRCLSSMKPMNIWKAAFPFHIFVLLYANGSREFVRRRARISSNATTVETRSVLCRVTTFHQISESTDGHFLSHAAIHCIPIIDHDRESDNIFPIHLPEDLTSSYEHEISRGKLLVSISNADFVQDELFIGDHAEYSVVNDRKYRHLQERHLPTSSTHPVTVAVIRISTPNEAPPASSSTLLSTLYGNTGFQKQYSDCSFGRLELINNGVYDVQISQTTAELGGDWKRVVEAAQEQVKIDQGLTSVQDLADKILMCVPPGTGDWAASADVNSWRAQFNSDWCTSLSATMHEIGHLFGLLHAQKNFEEYADYSGYMSASYKDTDWPKKCFNGQNSNYFGWYSDKQRNLDPLVDDSGALVELASFVDYPQTTGGYVNIAISNRYYLQYNVADRFNADTQDSANQVTITEAYSQGSNLIASLEPGVEWTIANFESSGKNLVIRACGSGVATNGAQTMLMSIAFDTSLCDSYRGRAEFSVTNSKGGGCFSGETIVEVYGKGMVKMDTLRIGDFVRVADHQFSQIYSFSHIDKELVAEYLQFFSGNAHNEPLEVTPDHMIYVSKGQIVRASQVRVGDQLLGMDHPVTEVRSIQRRGVYAPVTFAGEIIVSGVVASSYVSLLDTIPPSIMNTASHVMMGLHRTVCTWDLDRCVNESYNEHGINNWIATMVSLIMIVNELSIWIQIAAWILLVPLLVIAFLLEHWMYFSPVLVATTVRFGGTMASSYLS